jgi:hypothetical protein
MIMALTHSFPIAHMAARARIQGSWHQVAPASSDFRFVRCRILRPGVPNGWQLDHVAARLATLRSGSSTLWRAHGGDLENRANGVRSRP